MFQQITIHHIHSHAVSDVPADYNISHTTDSHAVSDVLADYNTSHTTDSHAVSDVPADCNTSHTTDSHAVSDVLLRFSLKQDMLWPRTKITKTKISGFFYWCILRGVW